MNNKEYLFFFRKVIPCFILYLTKNNFTEKKKVENEKKKLFFVNGDFFKNALLFGHNSYPK